MRHHNSKSRKNKKDKKTAIQISPGTRCFYYVSHQISKGGGIHMNFIIKSNYCKENMRDQFLTFEWRWFIQSVIGSFVVYIIL